MAVVPIDLTMLTHIPAVCHLFLSTMTVAISCLCAFDLYKDFALKLPQYDESDIFLNNFGLALPVFAAVGRLGWGFAGDHLPVWALLITGDGMSAFLQVLMYFTRPARGIYVVVCGLLAIMTGMMSVIPPIIKRQIGRKHLARNFGIVYSGELLGCLWYVTIVSFVRSIPDVVQVWCISVPAILAVTAATITLGKY